MTQQDDPEHFILLGRAPTDIGRAGVYRVPNPLPLASATPWVIAYAAVLPPSPEYAGHPVALLLTVKCVDKARRLGLDDEPPTHWEPWLDQVDNLYADLAMRRRSTGHPLAVQIGTWMHDRGLFASHSPARTDAGQAWAEQVGGHLPPREADPIAPDGLVRHAEVALARLRMDWGSWWSVDEDVGPDAAGR